MNTALPAMLDTSFGNERRDRGRFAEDLRSEPLVLFDLVTSVQSRPVQLEERVFSTTDGEKLTLDIYKPGYVHEPAARRAGDSRWQLAERRQQGIHGAQRLPRRPRLHRRLDELPARAQVEVPGGPRRRPVGDRLSQGLRPGVRPGSDPARVARAVGRRPARAARGLHRERAGDPRRRLGLRPDGSEVRVRAAGREGPPRHARGARELSRRLSRKGGRRVLRRLAHQLRERRRRRRRCSSTDCTTDTSCPRKARVSTRGSPRRRSSICSSGCHGPPTPATGASAARAARSRPTPSSAFSTA